MTASAGGRDLSQRLSKIETAISRRKTIEFTYYTMERGETEKRKVDPYHLVFRGGQFYLIGHSHERDAVRVFRLSRIQGKVGYASKAEHDFSPPEDFDRRDYGSRADWQLGETQGHGEDLHPRADRLADRARLRHLRRAARRRRSPTAPPARAASSRPPTPPQRELIAWVLRWRQNAQVLAPDDLREEAEKRRRPAARPPRERLRAGRDRRPAAARGSRARAAPTAAARRRSGPSASPASSPSPAC